MPGYEDVMLPLTEGQVEKIHREVKKGAPFSIRITSKMIGKEGTVPIGLTSTQIKKLSRAKETGKGAVINVSKTQLDTMRRSGSGFFSALSSLMSSIDLQKKLIDKAIADPIRKGINKSRGKGVGSEGGRSMVEEVSINPASDLISRLQSRADGELSGVRTYGVPKKKTTKKAGEAGKGLWTSGTGKGLWTSGTQQY